MLGRFIVFALLAVVSASTAFSDADADPLGPFDWSGFYVGAQGGIAAVDFDMAPGSLAAPGTAGTGLDFSGALVGPVIGINFQDGVFVYGLEGDASFGDLDKTNNVFTIPSIDVEAIGTIRGRVGVAFDRWLVFGTIGLGIASVDSSERGGLGEDSKIHLGVVAGVGTEYAFNQNLIGRVGLLAGWYEEKTHNYGPPHPVPHSHVIDFEHLIGQVSIVWKFGMK